MRLFRRRAPDPERAAAREAFRRVAAELDAAQRALLGAVPTSRDPGVPLAEALGAFEAGLARVEALMPGWRRPATEDLWRRCASALEAAGAATERLRSEPGVLGFEALNARVGDVLSLLEEFVEAARDLRRV